MPQGVFRASMATADPSITNGGNLPCPRRAVTKTTTRQCTPVLSPRLRQHGGCSRTCRRFLCRKIRVSAPPSLLPAVHFGSNFLIFANPANKKDMLSLSL